MLEQASNQLTKVISHMQDLFTEEELLIFLIVLLFVTFLPIFLCLFRKRGSVRAISIAIFIIYIFGNLSFTILNREVISDSAIILQPGSDFKSAFYLDLGLIGTIQEIFSGNLSAVLSSIHVRSSFMAREVLLNILLYLPMGYLLPFTFKMFRYGVILTTSVGFFCSLATEFTQAYFRIGVFQVDDILLNTLGTLIGAFLGLILVHLFRVK